MIPVVTDGVAKDDRHACELYASDRLRSVRRQCIMISFVDDGQEPVVVC